MLAQAAKVKASEAELAAIRKAADEHASAVMKKDEEAFDKYDQQRAATQLMKTMGGLRSSYMLMLKDWEERRTDRHEGTRLERGEHGLTVARRHAPLALALVVEEGDLRGRLAPPRHGLVEEPDHRAVLIRGQDLEAPQGVAGPGPIADGLEAAGGLVIGVTASARPPGLEWRRRLIVDVLATLNAGPDCIRQLLREALHLGRGVPRIDEADAANDGLEARHSVTSIIHPPIWR